MNKFKYFMVCAFSALSLYAGGNSSVNYGITQSTLGDADPGYGFDFGFHWIGYQSEKLQGVAFGLGVDMMAFTLGKVKSLNDDGGQLINCDLLTSYSFDKHGAPVTFFAGVGYGMGQIGSTFFKGINYQGGLEYDFSETKGIGLAYNHNDANDILTDAKSDLDNYILYFKYSPNNK